MQKFEACPSCGSTASLAGSNFCSNCGTRLTPEVEPEVPMAPAIPVPANTTVTNPVPAVAAAPIPTTSPTASATSMPSATDAPIHSVQVPQDHVRPGLDPYVQSQVTMKTLEMESAVYYKNPSPAMLDFTNNKAMGGILFIETSDVKGKFTVPKTIQVGQILNGAKIDMSIADFVHPVTTINAGSVLGTLKITVPRGVRVESQGFAILGSFGGLKGGQTVHAGQAEDSPLVIVRGLTILGGVSVKVNESVMAIRVVQ